MNRQPLNFSPKIFCIIILASSSAIAQNQGYVEMRGTWQATELVDNGRVIPVESIPGWLPSGGRIEIVDNSIVFTSSRDGQRHARVFSIDATMYPRQLNVMDEGQITGQGIYRIDEGRLVVCLSPPNTTLRPTDFSAREGSQRVLIVFERTDAKKTPSTVSQPVSAISALNLPLPPANSPSQPVVNPLTDADIRRLVPGTWKCNDAYGAFFFTLDKNGTYSTYRESVETSALQKVFRKLPLSSGTWSLKNGQAVLQCTSAVHVDRLYKSFPFLIRSVTPTEMMVVDYANNVVKAVRVSH
jgi:uncharacterized protein (TIGR03067 family)